jgi:hypothetical protein
LEWYRGGALNRKGAYFYVIDAFVAALILIGGIVMIYSEFIAPPPTTQTLYTAEGILTTLENTPVQTYDDSLIRQWIQTGAVQNPQRSMLEQLALFETTGDVSRAKNLSSIMATNVPQQINVEILVNGNLRYPEVARDSSDADIYLSAKRIVLLRANATDIYAPTIIEVRAWQ